MSQPEINLVVLRAADIMETLLFYKVLGMEFKQECHSQGVIHYACTLGTITIEIYPLTNDSKTKLVQSGAMMLGFKVSNIDTIVTQLQEISNTKLPTVQVTLWGRRVVLKDPDGRKVELTEL